MQLSSSHQASTGGDNKIVTKAGFVRNLSVDVPAAEVIAKAKREGFALSPAYVHKVRVGMRKAARETTDVLTGNIFVPIKSRAPNRRVPLASSVAFSRDAALRAKVTALRKQKRDAPGSASQIALLEARFRKLMVMIGLDRSRQVLAEVEQRFGSL